MSVIDTLVTNRTQSDVTRWLNLRDKGWAAMTTAERVEWQAGMRGAYNVSDLNRVQTAMHYVGDVFASCGYSVVLHPVRTWTMAVVPTQADMDAYLADLSTLRGVLTVLSTTPAVPGNMANLDWAKANDIEKILVDVDVILTAMSGEFIRAGMPWAVAGNEIYVGNR